MLSTSYDHGCHLTSRFCFEPNNYKVLLVIAGLASYTQLDFAIKPTAWRKFLGGHQFAVDDGAIEFEQKKIDIAVSCLDMYRTNLHMYRTMGFLARQTKVRR